MIGVKFSKSKDWPTLGQKQVRLLKTQILRELVVGLREFQDSILLTPVYTGRTLVNYRWTLSSPAEGVRAPVKVPTLPGKTSGLELGSEPRRAANSAVIQAEFAALIQSLRKDLFQDVFLVNNTPYFDQVEYGTYSTSKGAEQRTPPGGMVRRGETLLETLVPAIRRK